MKIQMSLAAVPISVLRQYSKKWNKGGLGVKAVRSLMKKGTKGYRLYVPIKPRKNAKVTPPFSITRAVAGAGYKIEDYVTGIAVDSSGSRRMRIGKLLKDAKLRDEFANDPQRSAHKDEFVCVLSAHPYDIIGMSTGRRWDDTSCMRLGTPANGYNDGAYSNLIANDIAEGTIVAYAISPKDTNIQKPRARLLIKPFLNSKSSSRLYFRVETSVYGTPVPGFVDTVNRLVRRLNKGADQGIYFLPQGLYDDGIGDHVIVGKYDDIEDKETFIENVLEDSGIHKLLDNDKRWLGHVLKRAIGASTTLRYLDVAVVNHGVKYVAKQVDEFLPDDVAARIIDGIAGGDLHKLALQSKKLKAMCDEAYSYHDTGEAQDGDFIFNEVAYWDSRWLASLASLGMRHARTAFYGFMRGAFVMTPELRDSKYAGAVKLRKYVGLLARVIVESGGKTTHVTKAKALARQFRVDTYFDEDLHELMSDGVWANSIKRYTTPYAPEGLLCAVDKSWPAQDTMLVDEGGNAIYTKKAFTNVASLRNDEIDGYLLANMREAIGDREMRDWIVQRPFVLKYLYALIKRSQVPANIKRAQEWLDNFALYVNDLKAIADRTE